MLSLLISECDCHEDFSDGVTCDQSTGQCTCKLFCNGRRCDDCF